MTWDDYFMTLARVTASKSRDVSTRVGAVLVDPQHRVISLGYNGLPRGLPDDIALLEDRETKLALTLHAENNAVLFAGRSVAGATCYVWPMPPCAHCAAMLIQAGVSRVVAPEPSQAQCDRWGGSFRLAQWAYTKAGVLFHVYGGSYAESPPNEGRCPEAPPVQLSLFG